jgi:hypothetical protein
MKQAIFLHAKRTMYAGIVALSLLAVPYVVAAFPTYIVTPLVIDETLEARDIVTRTVTVKNIGNEPTTIFPTVNNIAVSGGSIEAFLPPVMSDRSKSLASWIEIQRSGFDLKIGETKELPLTFRIAPSVEPGTYHAFIGFGSGNNVHEADGQVQSGQAPGVIVTITIADKRKTLLKLAVFSIDRFVTRALNGAAHYTFRNSGDEAVVPTGEIIFYTSTGKEVGAVAVNTEGVSIEPGKEHTFTAQVPVEGLFGRYKGYLNVTYGSQQANVQDTTFFYAFPLQTLITILAILIALVGCIAWYIHRKYLDTERMETDRLSVRVREGTSMPHHRDIDLKKKNE